MPPSGIRRRRPPLSGAFFLPSDLPPASLLRSLASLSAAALQTPNTSPSLLRNRLSLARKLETLTFLFTFLHDSISPSRPRLSSTALLCFRELYVLIYRIRSLFLYCSESSRVWLLLRNQQLCGDFRDLEVELGTVLDVLPVEELRLCSDLRELVEMLRRQCVVSKIYVDENEEFLRRKMLSFLSGIERGVVPSRDDVRELFVDGLGIRNVRGFHVEIEFLEEMVFSRGEEVNLSVLGGCVALMKFCRFLLFGFGEKWLDRGVTFVGDVGVSKKLPRGLSSRCSGDSSFVVPKDFCCPISLDVMEDPVVVSTGQTYDRASITQWIEEGHRTCPNSGQNLTSSRLVPNRALRSLISEWCAENEIPFDDSDSSVASADNLSIAYSSKAAIEANRALARLLIQELIDGSDNAKTFAARELRLLAKIGKENRAVIAELGAIPHLCLLFQSSNWIAQENAITAMLNLSIHDGNKCRIMEVEGCLTQIVYVLRYGLTPEARENAAATLFSLSAVHDYKLKIANEQGAVAALASLLTEGSTRGKKDAVMALFNISTHPESWSYMLDFGAVSALVGALRNESVAEEAAGALALLLKQSMVAKMVGDEDTAITNLIGLMRRGTPKGKENAVAALQEMCRKGGSLVTQRVSMMPVLHGLIQNILFTGTKRARRKAALLAKMCRRSESASSTAANMTSGGGWPDHTITRTSSISIGSGEVVPVPMVPVL